MKENKKKPQKPKKTIDLSKDDPYKFHNDLCDLDPRTLRWKRTIKKNEKCYVCLSCHSRVLAGEKIK